MSLPAVVVLPTVMLIAWCWTVHACEVEGIACALVVCVSRCQGSR
jgi:hypothetical protein